jgi:tRNA(Ile)-lysidine synthase
MLQKLQLHINEKFPFLKDKKILIATSGGVDSVVLTQLLFHLKFNISLAHCNFKLREKESDLDALFVEELAKKLKIDFYTTAFQTEKLAKKNKESTQIAARNLRYHWFQEISAQNNFDVVLTAHHADDNIETFLINLTRGSGLDGFTGIPAIQKNIVRPLLIFSREEIINYATEHAIVWREDQSNSSTKYTRNKIRHQVIPALKEINPSLLDTFAKTIENLQESQQIVADRIEEIKPKAMLPLHAKGKNSFKISIQEIQKASNPKAYLFQVLKAYHFTEFTDIVNLLTAQSGKQVFSKTHTLIKDRDFLLLSEIEKKEVSLVYYLEENDTKITEPIHLSLHKEFTEIKKNKNTIYVSRETLTFPLILRKWKNGDSFYPLGMEGRKKVSKYFKDEKISLLEKEEVWLLCNNDDSLIWIVGKRQDSRFYTSAKDDNTLKINININS